MLKIINIDGNVVVESEDEKEFKEKVKLYVEELIEEELLDKSPTKMYKKNLKLLYDNGYILEQDGILSGNNTTFKWYYKNII